MTNYIRAFSERDGWSFDHCVPASPSRDETSGTRFSSWLTHPISDHLPRRRILGIDVIAATGADVIADLLARLAARRKTDVAFANANLLTHASRNTDVAQALSRMLVLNDGIALDLASRALYGCGFPENLNGTDFMPRLIDALPGGTRIFLYGARAHVVATLAGQLSAEGRLDVCGWCDGYTHSPSLPDEINAARADVVLVALGNPRQELWTGAAREVVSAPLVIGVGAFFDFATGQVPRAPLLMRKLRMEWLFRLAMEPRRLWRRYTSDAAWFFYLVAKQAVRARK